MPMCKYGELLSETLEQEISTNCGLIDDSLDACSCTVTSSCQSIKIIVFVTESIIRTTGGEDALEHSCYRDAARNEYR